MSTYWRSTPFPTPALPDRLPRCPHRPPSTQGYLRPHWYKSPWCCRLTPRLRQCCLPAASKNSRGTDQYIIWYDVGRNEVWTNFTPLLWFGTLKVGPPRTHPIWTRDPENELLRPVEPRPTSNQNPLAGLELNTSLSRGDFSLFQRLKLRVVWWSYRSNRINLAKANVTHLFLGHPYANTYVFRGQYMGGLG